MKTTGLTAWLAARYRNPSLSFAFNLETLAAQIKETLKLVRCGLVGWVDHKSASASFDDLRSERRKIIEFVP
jgi:hypothetical protein